jgi:hypothetical protein
MAYQLVHKTTLSSDTDGGIEFTGFSVDADVLECRMTLQTDNYSSEPYGGITALFSGGTIGDLNASYPFYYQSGWMSCGIQMTGSTSYWPYQTGTQGAAANAGFLQGGPMGTGTPVSGGGTTSIGDWTPMVMRVYNWNNATTPTHITYWGGALNDVSASYYSNTMYGYSVAALINHPSYPSEDLAYTTLDTVVLYTEINIGSNPDYGEIKSGSEFAWYGWTDS